VAGGLLLCRQRSDERFVSRLVLAWMMFAVAAVMALRALYFLAYPHRALTSIDSSDLVSATTPFVLCLLPVMGTTAFLMMCAQRVQRQLQHAAAIDFLTGLPNRRTISATAEARIRTAQRLNFDMAVAIIDVDHFKSINDRLGHEAGDGALRHVAQVLASNARTANMVGRIGGEEFVVLLEGSSIEQAEVAAERLRAAVEHAPFLFNDQTITLTISVGLSAMLPSDTDFSAILRRADNAMYQAKAKGRNRVEADRDAQRAVIAH